MTPKQNHVMASVGAALLLLQTTESAIRLCMTFVLQKSSPLTLDLLGRQEKAERKKTLGYFFSELRNRVYLNPKFDSVLEEFLEMRNIFVHHLKDVPSISFTSEPGLAVAEDFVAKLIRLNEIVLNVFVGLIRAWQEQEGIDVNHSNHVLLEGVDSLFKPLIDYIFTDKST